MGSQSRTLSDLAAAAAVTHLCPALCNPLDWSLLGSCLWDFPGENTGVGCILKLEISERRSVVVQQSNLDEPAFSRKTARLNF